MVMGGALELPSDQDASGRSLGDAELELLRQVIESGTLTATKGKMTASLEAAFAHRHDMSSAVACASGTTAIHAAVAAIDPNPGDEVITTSITDMGALTPLLYQGAIPTFADVHPVTGNITAASVADRISDRTVAVMVTHLFGNPAEIDEIVAVAARHDLPVIEDCAQAYSARSAGRPVGTIGDVGCFSLQQGKHITCGEGGLVIGNDEALVAEARLWVNKGWGYGQPDPDHRTMALNGRISELQSAVALAQLEGLDRTVATRISNANSLSAKLSGVPGLRCPSASAGDVHSYWRYPLLVDSTQIPGGPVALATELRNADVASAPRYIQKPAFRCGVFVDRKGLGSSGFPFTEARPEALDHAEDDFAGTFRYLEDVLVLPWNEQFTAAHVERLAEAVAASVDLLRARA